MSGSVPERDQGRDEPGRELLLGREAVALTVSLLFTLPLLADTAAHWFGWRAFFLADAKIQLVLATLAHAWGGARFYAGAVTGSRIGMLSALAVGAIYLFGACAVFTRPEYAGVAFKVSTAALTLAILVRLVRAAQSDSTVCEQEPPASQANSSHSMKR